MCAAPTQAHALDGLAAAWAGLPGAPEDGQVLQVPALLPCGVAVLGVAQTRPAVADGRGQHMADGGVQPGDLARGEAARFSLWMQPGQEQGLIGVDVAQASQAALIEQEGLELGAPTTQHLAQDLGGEIVPQRLRAQSLVQGRQVQWGHQAQPPKLARVHEAQLGRPGRRRAIRPAARLQVQHHVGVLAQRFVWRAQEQPPRHAQVHNQQVTALQLHDDVLGPPPHAVDTLACQALAELLGRQAVNGARLAHGHTHNGPARQVLLQVAGDGFYFGQFRHGGKVDESVR